MLVWTGKGILIPIVFAVLLIGIALIFADGHTPFATAWILGPALLLTGAFSYYFGNKWNSVEGRIIVDKATGEEMVLKPNHSLFWIKMQYWGYIYAILGILTIVMHLA